MCNNCDQPTGKPTIKTYDRVIPFSESVLDSVYVAPTDDVKAWIDEYRYKHFQFLTTSRLSWYAIRDSILDALAEQPKVSRVGKVGKRIIASLRKRGIKESKEYPADAKIIDHLVQYFQNKYPESTPILFRFNTDLDWNAGDYGDDGSCFFSWRRQMRIMLQELASRGKAGAILAIDPKTDRGLGRALLVNTDQHGILMLNAYGVRLATFKYAYEQLAGVQLGNVDSYESYIYANGDQRGPNPNRVFYCTHGGHHTLHNHINPNDICHECWQVFDSESVAYNTDEYNGYPYCPACFDDRYVTCTHCDRVIDRRYADDMYDGLCEECADELYPRCAHCGSHLDPDNDDYFTLQNGELIHEDCAEDAGYTECELCNEGLLECQTHYIGHMIVCRSCRNEHSKYCNNCGHYYLANDDLDYDSQICPDCAQSHCYAVMVDVEGMDEESTALSLVIASTWRKRNVW